MLVPAVDHEQEEVLLHHTYLPITKFQAQSDLHLHLLFLCCLNETAQPPFSSPVALADARALELAGTPVRAAAWPPLDGHNEVAKTNLKNSVGAREDNKEKSPVADE